MSSKIARAPTTEVSWTIELTELSQLARDRETHIVTELSQGWTLEHLFYGRGQDGSNFNEPLLRISWPFHVTGTTYDIVVSHQNKTDLAVQPHTHKIDCHGYDQPACADWTIDIDTCSWDTPETIWDIILSSDWLQCTILIKTLSPDLAQHWALHPSVMNSISSQMDGPIPSDVRFDVVSRRRSSGDKLQVGALRPVYARSSVLTQCSDHLQRLLNGSFAESMIVPFEDGCGDTWFDEYEYWSDSDLDDEEDIDEGTKASFSSQNGQSNKPTADVGAGAGRASQTRWKDLQELSGRVVPIRDNAYVTWKALIFYLQTSAIQFAPLMSTGKRLVRDGQGMVGPPMVSPKSMYRLADRLQLTDLRNLSKTAIERQLTESNALTELFSTFSDRYDEFRQKEVDIIIHNRGSLKESAQMHQVVEGITSGSLKHASKALAELFIRLAMAHPSPSLADPAEQNSLAGPNALREKRGKPYRRGRRRWDVSDN